MNVNYHLEKPSAISKVLSPNDTGETGGHQAGILIPKTGSVLDFFPCIDRSYKNPRAQLRFIDPAGEKWNFMFIYYNNRFFGGTRNEYRLTGMTSFFKQHNLKAGDTITLQRLEDDQHLINYKRANSMSTSGDILRLGSSWRVINI